MKDMEEGKEPAAEPQEPGRPGGRLPELNEARVIGRIVNPAKMKEGAGAHGDYKMARFVLAVNRSYKDSAGKSVRETDFVPVVGWGAIAEAAGKAGKGSALRVEGRIRTWQVEGKQYRWELKADMLEILDLRRPAASEVEDGQKELLPS
jgi:single-stranded DNA-binding protein